MEPQAAWAEELSIRIDATYRELTRIQHPRDGSSSLEGLAHRKFFLRREVYRIWVPHLSSVVDMIVSGDEEKEWVREHLLLTLCILIRISAQKAIRNFREWFLVGSYTNLDRHLPVDRRALVFLDEAKRDLFHDIQHQFTPVVINQGTDNHAQLIAHRPIPYEVVAKSANHGAFGLIDKIKIAPGHITVGDRGYENPNWEVVACKTFERRTDLKKEVRRLQLLRAANDRHEHITLSLANFNVPSFRCIFFPWAEDGDLHEFLYSRTIDRIHSPQVVIRQMYGLAGALRWLHQPKGSTQMAHMDLKPRNILIFRDTSSEVGIWKLTDFGMAMTDLDKAQQPIYSQDDLDMWRFHNSVPGAQAQGEYTAPELSIHTLAQAAPLSPLPADVWSLGCILHEVVAFTLGGRPSVESLSSDRRKAHQDARFYCPRKVEIKDCVTKWLDALDKTQEWINYVYHIIERSLRIYPDERCDAWEVERLLWQLLREPPSEGSMPLDSSVDSLETIPVPPMLPGTPLASMEALHPTLPITEQSVGNFWRDEPSLKISSQHVRPASIYGGSTRAKTPVRRFVSVPEGRGGVQDHTGDTAMTTRRTSTSRAVETPRTPPTISRTNFVHRPTLSTAPQTPQRLHTAPFESNHSVTPPSEPRRRDSPSQTQFVVPRTPEQGALGGGLPSHLQSLTPVSTGSSRPSFSSTASSQAPTFDPVFSDLTITKSNLSSDSPRILDLKLDDNAKHIAALTESEKHKLVVRVFEVNLPLGTCSMYISYDLPHKGGKAKDEDCWQHLSLAWPFVCAWGVHKGRQSIDIRNISNTAAPTRIPFVLPESSSKKSEQEYTDGLTEILPTSSGTILFDLGLKLAISHVKASTDQEETLPLWKKSNLINPAPGYTFHSVKFTADGSLLHIWSRAESQPFRLECWSLDRQLDMIKPRQILESTFIQGQLPRIANRRLGEYVIMPLESSVPLKPSPCVVTLADQVATLALPGSDKVVLPWRSWKTEQPEWLATCLYKNEYFLRLTKTKKRMLELHVHALDPTNTSMMISKHSQPIELGEHALHGPCSMRIGFEQDEFSAIVITSGPKKEIVFIRPRSAVHTPPRRQAHPATP